jgi:hypothetical protein
LATLKPTRKFPICFAPSLPATVNSELVTCSDSSFNILNFIDGTGATSLELNTLPNDPYTHPVMVKNECTPGSDPWHAQLWSIDRKDGP